MYSLADRGLQAKFQSIMKLLETELEKIGSHGVTHGGSKIVLARL